MESGCPGRSGGTAEAERQAAAKARLEQAKPQHLEVATQRYTALACVQQGRMPPRCITAKHPTLAEAIS